MIPDSVFKEYDPMVKHIAYHMKAHLHDVVEVNDLIQDGRLGLIDAYENKEDEKTFKTYAGKKIKWAMLDGLRRIQHRSRGLVRFNRERYQAEAKLESNLGRSVTSAEVAKFMGISVEEYQDKRSRLERSSIQSLYTQANTKSDEDLNYLDVTPDESCPLPEDLIESLEQQTTAELAIQVLDPLHQFIVTQYFYEGKGLRKIGDILEVSESRVCQMIKEACRVLEDTIFLWNQPQEA